MATDRDTRAERIKRLLPTRAEDRQRLIDEMRATEGSLASLRLDGEGGDK